MKMRYFYSDPLAASWMAKHFGMRLLPDCWTELGIDDANTIISFRHPRFMGRWFVHADSLHLLEPQPGDLVFVDNKHGGEYWDEVKAIVRDGDESYPYTGDGRPIMLMDCGQYDYFDKLRRIIQRNGKAFHWPDTEKP